MSRVAELRRLLAAPPVTCLGAYDAMTALLAERAGAPVVYVSGYAASAARLGRPDLGIMTQSEMAEHVGRICAATRRPVIADADNGYGGVLNVQRTIELWEAAGVSGLHLEDQIFPKRCGHIAGKEVIAAAEMVQKLRAAAAARRDPDFLIIARTDALAVHGMEDALARCRLYAEAGADALFVDAPATLADLERITATLAPLGKGLVFNAARTLKSPVLGAAELHRIGFGLILYPIEALLVAHRAVARAYQALRATGSTEVLAEEMTSFADFNEFIGVPEYLARDAGFTGRG